MNEVCIEEDKTILEAMKQLDTSGKKVLFVQKEGKLLASLTDGDVRRWILKNGGLQFTVRHAANYEPKYLYEGQADLAGQMIKKYGIDAVPIVDKNRFIRQIVYANKTIPEQSRFEGEIPVVMMAGGPGVKAFPLYKHTPEAVNPHRGLSDCGAYHPAVLCLRVQRVLHDCQL